MSRIEYLEQRFASLHDRLKATPNDPRAPRWMTEIKNIALQICLIKKGVR